MNTKERSLLQVSMSAAVNADKIFDTLMGDEVHAAKGPHLKPR